MRNEYSTSAKEPHSAELPPPILLRDSLIRRNTWIILTVFRVCLAGKGTYELCTDRKTQQLTGINIKRDQPPNPCTVHAMQCTPAPPHAGNTPGYLTKTAQQQQQQQQMTGGIYKLEIRSPFFSILIDSQATK